MEICPYASAGMHVHIHTYVYSFFCAKKNNVLIHSVSIFTHTHTSAHTHVHVHVHAHAHAPNSFRSCQKSIPNLSIYSFQSCPNSFRSKISLEGYFCFNWSTWLAEPILVWCRSGPRSSDTFCLSCKLETWDRQRVHVLLLWWIRPAQQQPHRAL